MYSKIWRKCSFLIFRFEIDVWKQTIVNEIVHSCSKVSVNNAQWIYSLKWSYLHFKIYIYIYVCVCVCTIYILYNYTIRRLHKNAAARPTHLRAQIKSNWCSSFFVCLWVILLQYLELCNPLTCIKNVGISCVDFGKRVGFLIVRVAGKISKNLHIFVNFFVTFYVVVIACFGSFFLI